MQIAIDGPSGAGKSTIAKELAKKLQIVYVDTGAMYRAIGLLSLQKGIPTDSEAEINLHRKELIELASTAQIEWKYQDGRQILLLSGKDISDEIRTQQIGDRASKISTIKEVRQALVQMQQQIAAHQSVVMDGRDIGTVVLPDADYKIFLTASPEIRGIRRQKELVLKGIKSDLNTIIEEIIERDERDQNRKESPLRKAEDAVEVDTSNQSIAEVVETILTIVGK